MKNVVSLNFSIKLWVRIFVVIIIALVLIVSALMFYITEKVEKQSSLAEFIAYLEQRIPAVMKSYDIPGVNIALIKGGKTVWVSSYGYADREKGIRMTVDTYCRVESISKSVTAWGVMKLVEQGKIELDKPVEIYLHNWEFPKSKYAAENVTVRQLLSHSAGMPLGTIGIRYSPVKDNLPSLTAGLTKDAILIKEPGQSFLYSNTGFNVLELLIEEVTGRDFAEYMKEEVLNPLGMKHASFTWSKDWDPGVPLGYDLKGNPIPVYIYPEKAAGGLFATVQDIAAFVTAGMTSFSLPKQQVLNDHSINQLYTPAVTIPGFYGLAFDAYGFGHFIEILPNGKRAVSHGGQGSGWMSHFHSVPETGDGIIILTNSQRSWPFFAYLLTDWAQWNGVPSVGMSKIIIGTKALWVLIGLFIFILLWQIWRLGQGLISGRRQFAPLSKNSRPLRFGQSGVFVILISGLLWSINQDYLFISAVFPIASNWLGFLIFLAAIILLWSALFPCTEDKMNCG